MISNFCSNGAWKMTIGACVLISTLFVNAGSAQQRANSEFAAKVDNPRFEEGKGPVVAIDEAHTNFHTLTGRYAPFAAVLKADGFRLTASKEPLSDDALSEVDILVIANALHPDNSAKWTLPTPSAFSDDEIDALENWISKGGSLFLIADHMPFPGAAEELAKRFDIEMINGFAFERQPDRPDQIIRGPIVFKRGEESIGDHIITQGRDDSEQVGQVASFTGQVFRVGDNAAPLLTLTKPSTILSPKTAWQFNQDTEVEDATGLVQGAAIEHGEGRIVVFGEAAMFTSQTQGNARAANGLTAAAAVDNQKLLLNIVRWLGHALEDSE